MLPVLDRQPCLNKVFCRLIVERLAIPSVRRIFVIDPDSQVVEAIISLSDLAAYLFQ